jgi:hypothetical protein
MPIGIGAHASNAATSNTVLATPARTTQTAGSSFWGAQFTLNGDTTRSVADSKSNGYTQIGSAVNGNAGSTTLRQYYKENGVGGSGHTFTSTSNQGIGPSVFFCEIVGAKLVGVLHTSNQGQDSTSPYGDAITVTLTKPGLILALLLGSAEGTATHAEVNGFTIIEDVTDGANFWTGCLAYKIVGPGTYSAAFTETVGLSNGAPFAVAYAVFEEAPSIGRPLITGPGVGPDRMKQFTPSVRAYRSSASVFNDLLVESLSASDQVSALLALPTNHTETGAAADVISAALVAAASISESGASAADSISTTLAASAAVSESGAASDAVSSILVAVASLSESGSAADQLSNGSIYSSSITETGGASDQVSAQLLAVAVLSESGSGADLVSAISTQLASIVESGTATDSVSTIATLLASIAESGTATDSVSTIATLLASISEAGSASDSLNGASGGTTYNVSVIESGAAADLVTAALVASRALIETGAAADAVSTVLAALGQIAETGAASDALVTQWLGLVSLAEVVSAIDSISDAGLPTPASRVIVLRKSSQSLSVSSTSRVFKPYKPYTH